jgi:ribonuclease III
MEKVNPFNLNNKLINPTDIINVMETLNINNFKVNNILLYQTAFIHKSYCKELYEDTDFKNIDRSLDLQEYSYETMEFLGDSILGSIVSSYLYERFYKIYNQNEGFLTYLKNRIVCGESLAVLSKKIGLNKFIVISKHIEDSCDGRNNLNILEDVFEAFIGAIFLDNNYETIKEILLNIIEKYIDFTDIIIKNNNHKEQIIKYLQHNYKENPKYKDINSDNDKLYRCELLFQDKVISKGEGKSKKKAQQDASRNALIYYNVIN